MALYHSDEPASGSGGPPAAGEGVAHNPVLMRTREPWHKGGWVVPTLAGAVVLIGAALWGYVATHPAPPLVNHAVAGSDSPSGGT